MKCAICKVDDNPAEMVIDHILPRSNPEYNDATNVRYMHRVCHNRQNKWYWRLWYALLRWLDSFQPCNKELKGYRCQHREYPDGSRECGN